ncbi:MAG: hypothetical protein K1X39_00525 [Thermoflexales bacterium]|nr:hypothetical protein [Thermoflexales bacterium]
MGTETISTKLAAYGELMAALDVIRADQQRARDSVLTPEIRARLAEIELEFAPQIDAATARIDALLAEIKTEVLTAGETARGGGYTAVWSRGRASWNDKALLNYAVEHPEILGFRATGDPTVSLRKAKASD